MLTNLLRLAGHPFGAGFGIVRPFDEHGQFLPDESVAHVANLVVRTAGITISAQLLALFVQIASTVVLARVLAPHDFGVVTIVTTVSLLLGNFGQNGITDAILQVDEITSSRASVLFWLNVTFSGTMALLLLAIAPLLARMSGESSVRSAAFAIAPAMLLGSLPMVHLALLKRAMHYTRISLHDVFARAACVIVSIVFAVHGFGYWALVAGLYTQNLYTLVVALVLCPWKPEARWTTDDDGGMKRFSLNTYFRFSLNYVTKNLDNALVGLRFGTQALGSYKKAYDLFVLPTSQLLSPMSSVVVTTLSRLRNDPAAYRRYLNHGLSIIALIGMGVGFALTVVGGDIIQVVLGPQWELAGRIFRYFGPSVGLMLIYNTHSWIHLSLGRPDRWIRWGLLELAVTASLFVLGLTWGPVGVAGAWTAAYVLLTIPALRYAGAPVQFEAGPIVWKASRFLAAAMVAAWASVSVAEMFPPVHAAPAMQAAIHTVVNSSTFALFYSGCVVALFGNIEPFRELHQLALGLTRRR